MLILLSICLIASPTTCREDRLDWSFENASYFACFAHSQVAIVQWQAEHPLWRVVRWRCVQRDKAPTDL